MGVDVIPISQKITLRLREVDIHVQTRACDRSSFSLQGPVFLSIPTAGWPFRQLPGGKQVLLHKT